MVGFSQNTNALEKWTLTDHLRVAVSASFKATLELGGTQKENAPQTSKSRKSEKIVQEQLSAFSRVVDPFTFDRTTDVDNKYPLMNIYSGVVMWNKNAKKLPQASLIGEQEISEFVSKKFNSTTTFFCENYAKLYFRPVLLFNQL